MEVVAMPTDLAMLPDAGEIWEQVAEQQQSGSGFDRWVNVAGSFAVEVFAGE